MDDENQMKPETDFPPLGQEELITVVRQRIGIRKYIDFLRTIQHVRSDNHDLSKREQNKKIVYDSYVTLLVKAHFSSMEKERRNNGKTILDALKTMDLYSSFIQKQIIEFMQEAHAGGSYFQDHPLLQESYSMAEADREVLNHEYIMPHSLKDGGAYSRQGKELLVINTINQNIQIAEDALHEVDMQLARNEALSSKLALIIQEHRQQKKLRNGGDTHNVAVDDARSGKGQKAYHAALNRAVAGQLECVKNSKKRRPVEFSDIELAGLRDVYDYGNRNTNEKIQGGSTTEMEMRKLLRIRPLKAANHLLPLLKKRQEFLLESKKNLAANCVQRKVELLLPSIRRNSEIVKHKDYPNLKPENLLNDIKYPARGKDPPPPCFMNKGDDVWTQLSYEKGLIMQFEATRWHKEAFELLSGGGTLAVRGKVDRFLRIMETFFDLKFRRDKCVRANVGNFTGFLLYGDESLYIAIRLYHVLLVRLYTAYLYAEVEAAEWRFRNHCNEVGKQRLEAERPNAFVSEAAKDAEGWNRVRLPPLQGTPEERMLEFVRAVKKRESKGTYANMEFESDVMWAIGVQGNQLFTITTILKRIRETVRMMDDKHLEAFMGYCEQVQGGSKDATSRYEEEVMKLGEGWLFKFHCRYSDDFVDDDMGCVGEYGDVGRVTAMIVREDNDKEKHECRKMGKRLIGSTQRRKCAKKRKK